MRDRTKCLIVPIQYLSVANVETKLGTRTNKKRIFVTFTFSQRLDESLTESELVKRLDFSMT